MIVLLMGSVYKFTKRGWKVFLKKWHDTGEMPDIDCFATRISTTCLNITDLGIEDVKYHLEELANG